MKNKLKEKIREELIYAFNCPEEALIFLKKHIIKSKVISELIEFHSKFPVLYKKLFDLTSYHDLPTGLGKGEILLYFLYDDVNLSGISYSTDITKNNKPFIEIKSVSENKEYYYNFRLGPLARELSRTFIDNIKFLYESYKSILPDSPDIINWEEIPSRVLDYIESFGDINEIQHKTDLFKFHLSFNKNGILSSNDKIYGHIDDLNSLKDDIMNDWIIKKDNYNFIKIPLSNLEKIKKDFIKNLVNSKQNDHPFLLFNSKTGLPIKMTKLSKKNLKILRVTNGQVRIALLKEIYETNQI